MSASPVSVIICNYNCGRFLPESIQSVLNQEIAPLEILVADDGSSDNSKAQIQQYMGRVQWLGLPHGGQAAALNAALPQCRGEYVAFLESDDLWLPEKLRIILNYLTQNPRLSAAQHSMSQVDAGLNPLPTWLPPADAAWTLQDFLEGRTYLTGLSSLVLRREVLQKILPFPADLVTCVDEYIQPRLLSLGPEGHIARPLGLRRIHGRNFYADIRKDPARLKSYLSLKSAMERHLDSFLGERGLELSLGKKMEMRTERIQLELFLHRRNGQWRQALQAWAGILSLQGFSPYSLFKGATLGLALISPRFYLSLQRLYEKWPCLSRMRTRLFPGYVQSKF